MPPLVRRSKKGAAPAPAPPEVSKRNRSAKGKHDDDAPRQNTEKPEKLRDIPEETVSVDRLEERESRITQTPMTRSSTGNAAPTKSVDRIKELRKRIGQELRGKVSMFDADWLSTELTNLATDVDLDNFINLKRAVSIYSHGLKRWTRITVRAKDEKVLYSPLQYLINLVISELGGIPNNSGVEREAVIRDCKRMQHMENDPKCKHYTMPDIVIRAAGSSFEVPSYEEGEDERAVGYSNISGLVEVKLNFTTSGGSSPGELVDQIGVYVRSVDPGR